MRVHSAIDGTKREKCRYFIRFVGVIDDKRIEQVKGEE